MSTLRVHSGKIYVVSHRQAFGRKATSQREMQNTRCTCCEVRNVRMNEYLEILQHHRPLSYFRGAALPEVKYAEHAPYSANYACHNCNG
jgi:predicted methyltransferase